MYNETKLMLSDEELQLVKRVDWILTKRNIIEKTMEMFGVLSEGMQAYIEKEKSWLPAAVVQSTPKIAKGENYLQLPYLLMDFPRCFDAENIFVVRTMFWWGNFFSITLHLSGEYKKIFQQKIVDNLLQEKQEFFICVHESQWHHHFQPDNYIHAKQFSTNQLDEIILNKPFIKLAVKFPVQEWNKVSALLDESFVAIINMLKS